MTVVTPLDPYSQVVDEGRRWTPEWYTFLTRLSQVASSYPTLVASLPSAAAAGLGARYIVVDGSAVAFGGVVTGGGSSIVPIYSDGTNWRYG